MQAETLIAQCRWHSTFDQAEQATSLQDFISQWSYTVLKDELDRCFDARCPAHQTWRIETLELDLGDIALDDLAHELPHRLRARLHDALDHMLSGSHLPEAPGEQPNFRIVDVKKTLLETFGWFLKQGGLPWWFQASGDVRQLLDRLLAEQAEGLAELIRALGRSVDVRKRMAWQFERTRLQRVVHALEPWYGEVICGYVEQLCVVQARQRVPDVARGEFEKGVWFNTLSCLLVERGTLFNTITFLRDMIGHTAQLYSLAPATLLAQMHQAVLAMKSSGSIELPFFTAIEAIYRQHSFDSFYPPPTSTAPTTHDYWPDWQAMLRHGQARRSIAQDSVSYEPLFVALARQDPVRMRESLYREGASAVVREGMLQHLSPAGLAHVALVLVPGDHRFIVCHADHAQQMMRVRRWDEKSVWRVLLSWLLQASGSHFNRRQMVRETLQGICTAQGYSLSGLLSLLLDSITVSHGHSHRFELLAILRELLGDQLKSGGAEVAGATVAASVTEADGFAGWRGLLRYLRDGSARQTASLIWRRRFAVLLADHRSAASRKVFFAWLCSPELSGVSDRVLSKRLLALTNSADVPSLLELIEPRAASHCIRLLARLRDGHRLGWLPSLSRLDLAFHLPSLMLQALMMTLQLRRQGAEVPFERVAFWQCLMMLLVQQARVDVRALNRELHDCLPYDRCWSDALPAEDERSAALGASLRLSREGQAPAEVRERLLHDLACGTQVVIDEWVESQHNRYQALEWLTTQQHVPSIQQWLLALLPVELNPPQDTLIPLGKLLISSGCWQGAQALLDAQLQRLFWNISFDARGQRLSAAQWLARLTLSISQHLDIALTSLLAAWQTHLPTQSGSQWQGAYAVLLRQPDSAWQPEVRSIADEAFHQDYVGRYLWHPRLSEIARHLLFYGRLPAGLRFTGHVDARRLLHDLVHVRPDLLCGVLGQIGNHPVAMFRLAQSLSFDSLIQAVRLAFPDRQGVVLLMASLHRCIARAQLPGTTRQHREFVVFECVAEAAFSGYRAQLDLASLAGNVLARLMRERQITPTVLRTALIPIVTQAPEALRQAFQIVTQELDMTDDTTTPAEALHPSRAETPDANIPFRVNNAGLVILQNYFRPFFYRLGLTQNDQFISAEAQRRAVHYLQFLATGRTDTAEQYLVLNKVLCGLAVDAPIELSIEMTEAEQELSISLMKAVIQYWPALGKSSPEGLRGNFLARDGLLRNDPQRWELRVERRPYDVLLARSSLSYSVIKFPWMEKALYVTWPT